MSKKWNKKRDKRYGWVYILSNPAHKYLKIGKTERHPKTRAAELSEGTGTPFPMDLEFAIDTPNHDQLEREIHRELDHCRPNKQREFFDILLPDAVTILTERCKALNPEHKIAIIGSGHEVKVETLEEKVESLNTSKRLSSEPIKTKKKLIIEKGLSFHGYKIYLRGNEYFIEENGMPLKGAKVYFSLGDAKNYIKAIEDL